jgi:hypothetical protein
MKNSTPKAYSHPRYTAGHTIHIEDKAKTTPIRCVIVFNFSDILPVIKRIKMAKRPDFAARTFQSQ